MWLEACLFHRNLSRKKCAVVIFSASVFVCLAWFASARIMTQTRSDVAIDLNAWHDDRGDEYTENDDIVYNTTPDDYIEKVESDDNKTLDWIWRFFLHSNDASGEDVEHMYEDIRSCTQQERLAHVRKICQRSSKKFHPPRKVLIDYKHQLFYCAICKIGGSSFKTLLQEASGKDVAKNLWAMHGYKFLHDAGLMYLSDLNATEKESVVKNHFMFYNVRHPLERLLSAYRDKVGRPSDFPGFAAGTLKFNRKEQIKHNKTLRRTKTPQNYLGYPTFKEFLSWVLVPNWNRHWSIIAKDCQPCAFDYDAILRIETMQKDSHILLDKLKPDIPHNKLPKRHTLAKEDTHFRFHKHIPEYLDVEDSIIEKLLETYQVDLELFGYQWDMKTRTAYCAIDTPDGRCC